ncbi:MAG: cadherin repeat domain-containing protein [Eubacterium sp.]|nr:cadherin repeat domain-containing protein [Eubacterium sp.]
MKKIIALALTFIMVLTATPITALADNGPNKDNNETFLRVYEPDADGYYFDDYGRIIGKQYELYANGQAHASGIAGVSYNLASNTLTLDSTAGTKAAKLRVIANMMGDDFKIVVNGECELASILVWGFYYGGSLRIDGSGTLTVNKNKKFDSAILIRAEATEGKLAFGKNVKLKLYGRDFAIATAESSNTDASQAIVFENGQVPQTIKESAADIRYERVNCLVYTPNEDGYGGYQTISKSDPEGIYGVTEGYVGSDPSNTRHFVGKYIYIPRYNAYLQDYYYFESDENYLYGELALNDAQWEAQNEFTVVATPSGEPEKIDFKTEDQYGTNTSHGGNRMKRDSDPSGIYAYATYGSDGMGKYFLIERLVYSNEQEYYVKDTTFETVKVYEENIGEGKEWSIVEGVNYNRLEWEGTVNALEASVYKDKNNKKYIVYDGKAFALDESSSLTLDGENYYYTTENDAINVNDLEESVISEGNNGLYNYYIISDAIYYNTTAHTTHTWDKGKVTKKATVKAAGNIKYTCTVCGEVKNEAIAKNNFKVTAKKKVLTLGKAGGKIKAKSAYSIKNKKGKITYKKAKGNKKITVSKTGVITVKKGLKKGKTYAVKVKVTDGGNSKYAPVTKVVTIKIKIN